jgi:hypothetical protein
MAIELELFDLEGIAREVRSGVQVMNSQVESGSESAFIERGWRAVDEQVAALGCFDNTLHSPGIDRHDRNRGSLAQKLLRTRKVLVSTPDPMALTCEQLSEQRTRRSGTEDEDPHGTFTLP